MKIWISYLLLLDWTAFHTANSERSTRTAQLHSQQPWFISNIENVTAPQGREARLSCGVENLGDLKVAWIYKGPEGRTVLTAATQTVTKNPRISASQEGSVWVLSIKNVSKKDEGTYLCQVNSKPTIRQHGFLAVVVPPVIDDAASSNDVDADEGQDVTLMCDARGDPEPQIRWRKEQEQEDKVSRSSTSSADGKMLGKTLTLRKVTRKDTGAYLCIASNGVPPSPSKRIMLDVNFPPRILDEPAGETSCGVVIGTDLNLTCRFKARPVGTVKWFRGPEEMIDTPPYIHIITRKGQDSVSWISNLSLRLRFKQDFGSFHCVVENRLGKDQSSFKVFEVTTTSTTMASTTTMELSTTRMLAPTLIKPKSNFDYIYGGYGSQPPYFPWFIGNETTTKMNKNRFVQDDKISNIERRKKTQSHKESSQGSFFGSSSSLSHVSGFYRFSALRTMLYIIAIIYL